MSAEQARQAALDRVGDAYVYGAWDQDCTIKNREKYANLSNTYADAIRNQCQRQKGSKATCEGCKYEGHRIHDCRGLTDACAKAAGIKIDGQTVASQWKSDNWDRKDTINTLPRELPYVQLFRYNGTKWTHTGIYIGDDTVIDARGHANGVIQSKLSSYKWTHWAIPKGMYEEGSGTVDPMYKAIVSTKSGGLNMRTGPGTSYTTFDTIPRGAIVDVVAEYDTGWDCVAYNGKTGYVSAQYLKPYNEPKADEANYEWGVFIPCNSELEAQCLAVDNKGAVIIRKEKL